MHLAMLRQWLAQRERNKQVAARNAYSSQFYADRHANTIVAATTVLGPLVRALKIRSVVDIGCGVGTWLFAAKELGVMHVFGIEGDWVDDDWLKIDKNELYRHNLIDPFDLGTKSDLALSLEVAEHLPAERGPSFVQDLCKASDMILFSAAIPGQGGAGHVNEQWQSYWAQLFELQQYLAFDCVRPQIWGKDNIPWWYQQNTVLYCSASNIERVSDLTQSQPKEAKKLDLVHPSLYLNKLKT